MLDTQVLCARVTTPAKSRTRVLRMTEASYEMAAWLRKCKLANKTATRILTDALQAALDELEHRNGAAAVQEWVKTTDAMTTTKVSLSMPESVWECVGELAHSADVTTSQVARALSHVAVQQVYDELTRR